jgi:hypothetical protein
MEKKLTGKQTKLKNEFIAVEEMAIYYKRYLECFEEKYNINILFFLTLKFKSILSIIN